MRLFYNFKSNKLTRNGLLVLAIIIFCLSLIYLTTKVFIKVPDAQGLDFRFLWLAELGQTSIICVLGLVLILYGACQNYLILGIIGGYLLSIKPQIAIVILTALFFAGNHRIVIGTIVLITLALALAFYQTGISENITRFLTNLSAYSQEKINQPPDLTGLVHLIDYFLSIQVSSKIMAIFGIALGILCGFLISRCRTNTLIKLGFDRSKPNFFQIGSIILTVIATGFLMPMHVYDFVIFLPIVIASLYLPFRYSVWFIPGWMIILRANNLANITNFYHPQATNYFRGSLLISLTIIYLLIVSVLMVHNCFQNLRIKKISDFAD